MRATVYFVMLTVLGVSVGAWVGCSSTSDEATPAADAGVPDALVDVLGDAGLVVVDAADAADAADPLAPIACGSTMCAGRRVAGFSHRGCCASTAGGAPKCGLTYFDTRTCIPVKTPGSCDTACPSLKLPNTTALGCCRPEGVCGYYDNGDPERWGCVRRPEWQRDAGADIACAYNADVPATPQNCSYVAPPDGGRDASDSDGDSGGGDAGDSDIADAHTGE